MSPTVAEDSALVLVVELFFTFVLVCVALAVSTSRSHPGNGFYGHVVGLSLAGCVFAAGGGASGAAFNPAAVGMSMIGELSWLAVWVHLVGNLLGAVLAAGLFLAFDLDDGGPDRVARTRGAA
ncbi:aquaporin [Lentzea pudingi]|uniref:aquaporin n=1 Tax=Lentzea pudingi TaxID=1789439 RepID=UPI00227A8B7C